MNNTDCLIDGPNNIHPLDALFLRQEVLRRRIEESNAEYSTGENQTELETELASVQEKLRKAVNAV